MSKMLDNIKKAGAAEALSKACNSRLWTARQFIESASQDSFKNFARDIAKARTAIDEAEEILGELGHK